MATGGDRKRKAKLAAKIRRAKRARGIARREVRAQYRWRDRRLREAGFSSYRGYLASVVWRKIRARVMVDGPQCWALCGRKATQVHHTDYFVATLAGDDLSKLLPVCGACHQRIEYHDKAGHKLSPSQASSKLRSLRAGARLLS